MVHSIDISMDRWEFFALEGKFGDMVSIAAQRCDSFLTVYASALIYPPSRSRRAKKMSKLDPLMVNQQAVVFRQADALVEDIPAAVDYLRVLSERGIRSYIPRFILSGDDYPHWHRVSSISSTEEFVGSMDALWEAIEAEMEVDRIPFVHVDRHRDADFLIREIRTNMLLD